jgi:TRAP-type C4-dicarboxylate transport system permease small subunit
VTDQGSTVNINNGLDQALRHSGRFPLRRAIDKLAAGGLGLASVLIGLMGLNIVLDVVGRNVFGQPLPSTLEMVQFLWMPGLAILALGHTTLRSEEIRVTVLTDALSPAGAKVADIASAVVAGGLMGWVMVLCWERALVSFQLDEKTAGTAFPIWPGRFLVAIGVTILLIAIVGRLSDLLRPTHPGQGAHS